MRACADPSPAQHLRALCFPPPLLPQAVVAGVAAKYQQLADDTLSTVRKTESSLKRLKGRQRPGGGGAEGEAGGAAGEGGRGGGREGAVPPQRYKRPPCSWRTAGADLAGHALQAPMGAAWRRPLLPGVGSSLP